MTMSADRREKYDKLKEHEAKLTNGHRGDLHAMSDALVDVSRALRVILDTDFVTPSQCEASHRDVVAQTSKPMFGWPASVTAIGLMVSIVAIVPQGGCRMNQRSMPATAMEHHP